jgi:hypothetical protein
MVNIYRSITTGVVALATSGIALSFAGAAQAQIVGTLSITGNASIDTWGTANPTLTPLNVNTVVSASGQFAGVTVPSITTPNPFTLSGTGVGPVTVFGAPPASPSFVDITVSTIPPTGPGPGVVVGNATPTTAIGTFTAGFAGGGTASHTVSGTMVFDEPNGFPSLLGTFNITFTRSDDGAGNISQGYTLSLQKTNTPAPPQGVPEPSAVLGMLALGLAGFARRNKA